VRFALGSSWGIEVPHGESAAFHIVLSGPCWLRVERDAPIALSEGDVFLVPHGLKHWLRENPEAPSTPLMEILVAHDPSRGAVYHHGAGATVTELVCGSFDFEQGRQHPLRSVLPRVLHLSPHQERSEAWLEHTLSLLAREASAQRPGNQTVTARLTELLLVQVLRVWLEKLPEGQGGWLGALRDRKVGAAISSIHRAPSTDWTVSKLASIAGMGRSAFSERFSLLVGEPPIQYLSRWRLHVAASLLRRGQGSVANVAAHVGYQSESSFSKAFSKLFGTPPSKARVKNLSWLSGRDA
jgi:AraC-like DNA-binding protein